MNQRGIVSEEDAERIERARAAKAHADANWRAVVLEVAGRSSIRATAKVAGVNPDTIVEWKKQPN